MNDGVVVGMDGGFMDAVSSSFLGGTVGWRRADPGATDRSVAVP